MWILLAALGVAATSMAAVAGLLAVRRTRLQAFLGENDVAGLLFGAMAVLYGVLLAFVVFAAWEGYSRAEQAVTTEAADLVVVYRDTEEFPAPLQQRVQNELRSYDNRVVDMEWDLHGMTQPMKTAMLIGLNPVWDIYRQVDPSTPLGVEQLVAAKEHLHDLELERHLRHLAAEATIPTIFWPVLVIGGIVVVLFSYILQQSHLGLQAAMIGLLAALIASVLLLILSLNQPFTGLVQVSSQPFEHALEQFNAITSQAPIKSQAPMPSQAPMQ